MLATPAWVNEFLGALLMGSGVFILIFGLAYLLQARRLQRQAWERLQILGRVTLGESWLQSALRVLEARFAKTSLGKIIRRSVDAADLQWSLLMVAAIWFGLVLTLFLALYLLLQLAAAANLVLSLLAASGLLAFFFINRKDAYERALQAQTPDIAQLISNSLRAGQSLYYALYEVEEKLPKPASREFRELRQRIDLGDPMDQALRSFMLRHPGEEIRILITSLLVQRRAGGDLIATLATISNAIRARRRVRNEVDTITAEARQTSLLVMVMPFFVLVILNRISPGMVARFISWPPGLVFFIVIYLLPQAAAFLIIRRMGNVRV
ncbi:MAG: type II secretion system F family protein [Caldilineaceae bacterium]